MRLSSVRRLALVLGVAGTLLGALVPAASAVPPPPPPRHQPRPVTVFVAGDSTASTWPLNTAPRAGWGQALPVFLTSAADRGGTKAQSGASSKSFVDSGLLTPILSASRPGDFLLISFGHNDEKTDDPARYTDPATTFKTYLSQFIDGATAKGATPVLVTPVERRRFDSAGVAQPSHGAYPAAMRELAAAKGVPLVDLTALQPRPVEQARRRGHQAVLPVPGRGRERQLPGRGRGQHALPGARRDRGGPAGGPGSAGPARAAAAPGDAAEPAGAGERAELAGNGLVAPGLSPPQGE